MHLTSLHFKTIDASTTKVESVVEFQVDQKPGVTLDTELGVFKSFLEGICKIPHLFITPQEIEFALTSVNSKLKNEPRAHFLVEALCRKEYFRISVRQLPIKG